MLIEQSIIEMRKAGWTLDTPSIQVLDRENCMWKCPVMVNKEMKFLVVQGSSFIILTQTALSEIAKREEEKKQQKLKLEQAKQKICYVHSETIDCLEVLEAHGFHKKFEYAKQFNYNTNSLLERLNSLHQNAHAESMCGFLINDYDETKDEIAELLYVAREHKMNIKFDQLKDGYVQG